MPRTGRPRIASGPRPRAWLLSRVVQDGDCWLWTGDLSRRGGYGRVYLGIDSTGKKRFESAAVAFYREFVGPIPDGGWMLHRCDNPPCVNPDHLFVGSHRENMRDMVEKGRSTKGTRRPSTSKLNEEDVRAIRASTESQRKLAARYGVDGSTICRIRTGQRHKGVP